jgi:hypothetical protein
VDPRAGTEDDQKIRKRASPRKERKNQVKRRQTRVKEKKRLWKKLGKGRKEKNRKRWRVPRQARFQPLLHEKLPFSLLNVVVSLKRIDLLLPRLGFEKPTVSHLGPKLLILYLFHPLENLLLRLLLHEHL